MNDKIIRRVLVVFLFIAAVIVGVALAAVRHINQSVASSDWVNHTHSVIQEIEALRSDLYFADGSLRTFVMTGDAHDRAACIGALADVSDDLEITKALTRSEPGQSARVSEIESLIGKRVEFVRGALSARQSGGIEAVRAMLAADAGGAALQEIKRVMEKLKNDELGLLTERDTASYLQAQAMRYTVWMGVALDVLLLASSAWLIKDDIAARRALVVGLQAANDELERKVQIRTAELALSNAKLSSENLERQWTNQSLEHQVRYNQLIIDSINDLVFVVTKALNISRMNPAVARVTGFSASDLVGRPLSQVAQVSPGPSGAEAPPVDLVGQALGSGNELRDRPAVLEDKRGRHIPVIFSMIPLRDKDKVVGAVVTVQAATSMAWPQ